MIGVQDFYSLSWKGFSAKERNEAEFLLFKRFSLNKIPFSLVEGKRCLDVGCGSGRYSLALLSMGAKEVVGIDINKPVLKHKDFKFFKGDFSTLPFKESNFDFVFCNGVLHHSPNWENGLKECHRVLKKEGWIWYLGAGASEKWKDADQIRAKVNKKDAEAFARFLKHRSWSSSKIFFLLDMFFVPYRDYATKQEIKQALITAGFSKARFLNKDLEETKLNLRFIAKKE